MGSRKILIVEDEMLLAVNMKMTLEEAGYVVSIAIEGQEAIRKVQREQPDIVLMDITLSGRIDGIEVTRTITDKRNVPIIYLTGNTDDNTIQRMMMTNPVGVLKKPIDDYELIKMLEKIG